MPRDDRSKSSQSQSHGLNDDDIDKMVADAAFYFLVADQKKALIKVDYNNLKT